MNVGGLMKLTNSEAENLANYYFQKAVIGIVGSVAVLSVVGICIYKIGSFVNTFIQTI